MLKKILIIFLVIVGVGYASAFVRGYQYQSSKAKDPIENTTIKEKQEILDEEIVNDILSNSDVSKEVDNNSTEETNQEVKKNKTIQS